MSHSDSWHNKTHFKSHKKLKTLEKIIVTVNRLPKENLNSEYEYIFKKYI